MDTYLGHTAQYWLELEKRVATLGQSDEKYIEEIVALKGKIAFYESRIAEMSKLCSH